MPAPKRLGTRDLSSADVARELIKTYKTDDHGAPLRVVSDLRYPERADGVAFLIYELGGHDGHDPDTHGVFRVTVERL